MDIPWELLQSAFDDVRNSLWDDFATEGKESAILEPLGRYPNAAAWLAEGMRMSSNYITRKLGAMLAGWINDPKHAGLLETMLNNERTRFLTDAITANSVGEDIMFAATRWTMSENLQVRDAGIAVLANMIRDALTGTQWNTAHWAAGNLYKATRGRHDILKDLQNATAAQLQGQNFLQKRVATLKEANSEQLEKLFTAPSESCSVSPEDPNYPAISDLWKAARAAEASL